MRGARVHPSNRGHQVQKGGLSLWLALSVLGLIAAAVPVAVSWAVYGAFSSRSGGTTSQSSLTLSATNHASALVDGSCSSAAAVLLATERQPEDALAAPPRLARVAYQLSAAAGGAVSSVTFAFASPRRGTLRVDLLPAPAARVAVEGSPAVSYTLQGGEFVAGPPDAGPPSPADLAPDWLASGLAAADGPFYDAGRCWAACWGRRAGRRRRPPRAPPRGPPPLLSATLPTAGSRAWLLDGAGRLLAAAGEAPGAEILQRARELEAAASAGAGAAVWEEGAAHVWLLVPSGELPQSRPEGPVAGVAFLAAWVAFALLAAGAVGHAVGAPLQGLSHQMKLLLRLPAPGAPHAAARPGGPKERPASSTFFPGGPTLLSRSGSLAGGASPTGVPSAGALVAGSEAGEGEKPGPATLRGNPGFRQWLRSLRRLARKRRESAEGRRSPPLNDTAGLRPAAAAAAAVVPLGPASAGTSASIITDRAPAHPPRLSLVALGAAAGSEKAAPEAADAVRQLLALASTRLQRTARERAPEREPEVTIVNRNAGAETARSCLTARRRDKGGALARSTSIRFHDDTKAASDSDAEPPGAAARAPRPAACRAGARRTTPRTRRSARGPSGTATAAPPSAARAPRGRAPAGPRRPLPVHAGGAGARERPARPRSQDLAATAGPEGAPPRPASLSAFAAARGPRKPPHPPPPPPTQARPTWPRPRGARPALPLRQAAPAPPPAGPAPAPAGPPPLPAPARRPRRPHRRRAPSGGADGPRRAAGAAAAAGVVGSAEGGSMRGSVRSTVTAASGVRGRLSGVFRRTSSWASSVRSAVTRPSSLGPSLEGEAVVPTAPAWPSGRPRPTSPAAAPAAPATPAAAPAASPTRPAASSRGSGAGAGGAGGGGAFRAMAAGVRSFRKYVPQEVVAYLLRTGREAVVGLELTDVSVLFADVADFTGLTERLGPDQLVVMLQGFMEAVSQAVHRSGGSVDKYIGDAVMALFNRPAPLAEHARRAVEAALQARRDLERVNARLHAYGIPPLGVRFGVATGEALVGNIGCSSRLSYTALGDTVNTAARLEPLNKHYGTGLLCTSEVKAACGERYLTRFVDRVLLKGKTEACDLYEVVVERERASPAQLARCSRYQEALEAFLNTDITGADRILGPLAEDWPSDRATQLLHKRVRAAIQSPDLYDDITDFNA
eukprot:tig00000865_g5062.t1